MHFTALRALRPLRPKESARSGASPTRPHPTNSDAKALTFYSENALDTHL